MLQDAYLVNTLEQISTYIISPLALSTTTWMDLGGHCAKRKKSDTERKILHNLTYVQNLKDL